MSQSNDILESRVRYAIRHSAPCGINHDRDCNCDINEARVALTELMARLRVMSEALLMPLNHDEHCALRDQKPCDCNIEAAWRAALNEKESGR